MSADLIATLEGFSRKDCDQFAYESQMMCKNAMEKGYFKKSTVPVKDAEGKVVLDHEEFPRANTTLEGWRSLSPRSPELTRTRVATG